MALLEMRFLGGLTLQQDGVPLTEVKSQKGRALLCYLAVSQKQASRPYLAALFWPDMPDDQALMNLRKVLNRLKPLTPYLLITRETVAFDQNADCWLDVTEFEEGTATSTLLNLVEPLNASVPQDISRLQKALTLYQGDFLDGFMLADAPLFEEWLLAQRARLREAALTALHHLVTHFREDERGETATSTSSTMLSRSVQAIHYARQLLTIEPWHEETHRELMHLLALSDQRSAALAQYEICRHLLADELGVEPSAATVQLVEQIKAGQVSAGTEEPESRSERFPPHNLPPQMTPFVGREAELARLQQLLAEPDVRLITILGSGGMGKTRLALALAERELSPRRGGSETHPYPHGVYFASLARLESADYLLPAIAEATNFHFTDGEDQREQLLRYLAGKALLLVLDNFEHLLSPPASPPMGGTRGGAGLVDAILQTAPQIKIVITSRARVNRQSEQLFPVGGMAYPAANDSTNGGSLPDLNHYSAVQLFEQCARRVRPGFELTAVNQSHILKICQLLQGMPLGIVLAASWLESLSTRAISREMQQSIDFLATDMEDVPRRQRSLRAAFNHSWRLLSAREQEIFCQMSIFRGGFSRAAAQAVTEATLHDLQALVNKSLLTLTANGRYDVHELLRQFAAEKLSEVLELETAVRERHSAYYCTLLQQHTPNWHNARQLETLAEVTREANNVQSAWRWALQQEVWQRLHEMIDGWSWYHIWRSLHADGEAFCQAVCASVERWVTTKPVDAVEGYLLWAKAMTWYGEFAMSINISVQRFQQSLALLARPELAGEDIRRVKAWTLLCLGNRVGGQDRQMSRSFLEQSLSLYEVLQDTWGLAMALGELGHLDWGTGHYDRALSRVQASLDIHQKRGDQWEQVAQLGSLTWIYKHLGHLAKAEQLGYQAFDLCQQLGDRASLTNCAANLAFIVCWQGRFDEMKQWAEKSLVLCQEVGFRKGEGYASLAIGVALLFSGQYEQAGQELRQTLALVRKVNDDGVEATVHWALGSVALVTATFDEAQAAFAEGLRLYQAVQDNYIFFALSGLGLSTCCYGDLDQSRQHFIELLMSALRLKDFLYLLMALPGLALYLVRRGKVEQAITVWAQAQCWPFVANSPYYEDLVGREITAVAATLSLETAQAAYERGRALELWETAVMLLADLEMQMA